MPEIVNGAVVLNDADLKWFTEHYSDTEWAVYTAGIDETVTHDQQGPGDDPDGEPFTEESARAYLAELNARFGPGSPMDRELPGEPLYAVALHHGVPAFKSHQHSYPLQPPNGSFAHPGNCDCGAPYADEQREEERLAAEELAAVEWAVFVFGPNTHLVAQGQAMGDYEPAGPPFTEDTASRRAVELNEVFAGWAADDQHGYEPKLRAVVLHHGVLVVETAGA